MFSQDIQRGGQSGQHVVQGREDRFLGARGSCACSRSPTAEPARAQAYHVLMSVLFLLAMFDFTVIKTWFAFLDNWVFLGKASAAAPPLFPLPFFFPVPVRAHAEPSTACAGASMVYLGCVSLSLSVDASIDSDSQREAVRVIW
jgi:hypothetical protein